MRPVVGVEGKSWLLLAILLLAPFIFAQSITPTIPPPSGVQRSSGQTVVVIPFENSSPTPGLEWLGDAFAEALHQLLDSPVIYVTGRDERLRAYDRMGVPAAVHPSRATLYRLAEQMDVDYAVLGSYQYDGAGLTVTAQLLDMRAQKLSSAVVETAPLAELSPLESALAWDLLHMIRPDFTEAKEKFQASAPAFRLDAQENYVRGLSATVAEEKIKDYLEALRLSPDFGQAALELGKIYYDQRAYEAAEATLTQITDSSPVANEGKFYLGLAAYSQGDLARSEDAFEFVATRLPLAEVYNNLGVVARRNKKKAADFFEKAIQNDPSDADYHFNMAAALSAGGDRAGTERELRADLDRRPDDSEAKALLEGYTSTGGSVIPSSATTKPPLERIKRNYEEEAFRQMTTQMAGWAEQRFGRSDSRAHARFHVELGKELLAHGFISEAEAEFVHAQAVDPSSGVPLMALADAYDASGQPEQARSLADAALRVRESAEAYLILARLDLRENRMQAAEQNINRAAQLEPTNSAVQDFKHSLAARTAATTPLPSQP